MLPLHVLARLRERTYRLLGGAFLYPDDRRLAGLVALARDLRCDGVSAAPFAFYLGWSRCVAALATADGDPASLRSAYVRTFLVDPVGAPCIPQESAYGDGGGGMGGVIAELEAEYAAAGLAMGTGEPADHVAVEFGFMAILCGEEASAWPLERDQGERWLARERAFLDAHPARWLPALAEDLGRRGGAATYRLVGEAAWSFVRHDVDLLDLLTNGGRVEAT